MKVKTIKYVTSVINLTSDLNSEHYALTIGKTYKLYCLIEDRGIDIAVIRDELGNIKGYDAACFETKKRTHKN